MMKLALKESFLGLQKFTKLPVTKKFLLVILLIGLLVLLLPSVLRDSSFMVGEDSFYHLGIAQSLIDKNFKIESNNFTENGTGYLIAGISFITKLSVELSAKLLLIIVGLTSLLLFHFVLKFYEVKEEGLILFVYILSPAFIYLHFVVNKFAIPLLLTFLLIALYQRKKYFLSVLSYFVIVFFSYAYALILLILGVLIFLYWKREKLLLIISFILLIFSYFNFKRLDFGIISDFGNDLGVGIFGVFIIIHGLGSFWKKKRLIKLYFFTILLFLISLKFMWTISLLNVFFSILVGFNLSLLLKSKWENNTIKELTSLLLICGLLFSGLSTVNLLSNGEPNESFFDGISILPKESVVLTHHSNGHWLSYYGLNNVVNGFTGPSDDVDKLFSTRDFEIAIGILDEYEVDFILVDENMRHGLVWNEDEQGLLFLLEYSDRFEKIYDEEIEIWKYG